MFPDSSPSLSSPAPLARSVLGGLRPPDAAGLGGVCPAAGQHPAELVGDHADGPGHRGQGQLGGQINWFPNPHREYTY